LINVNKQHDLLGSSNEDNLKANVKNTKLKGK